MKYHRYLRIISCLQFVWTICLAGDDMASRGRAPAQELERELQAESAVFLQRRLAAWGEQDARDVLGDPLRHRFAYEQKVAAGDIYTFADPTGRYREFELWFRPGDRKLHAVFVYPWRMTWQDCRNLWGRRVSLTRSADGVRFYSYLRRRLDVLVDKRGNVINFGLY